MSLDNRLDSLVHRELSERGTEEEHEYLWFASDEESPGEPVNLDVFNSEGSLTVASDTDVGLRDFLERVESWYTVAGRGAETQCLVDGEWRSDRPGDIIPEMNQIEAFDFHFHDEFDYFNISWTDYSDDVPPELPDKYEVSMTIYHDNVDSITDPKNLEPLKTVLPGILRRTSPGEARHQVVGDLIKYISSSRGYSDTYSALQGFDTDAITHYMESSAELS